MRLMGTKTQALGHNYEQQWGGEAETKWLGFNENYLENSIIFLPIQQFSYFQAFHFSPHLPFTRCAESYQKISIGKCQNEKSQHFTSKQSVLLGNVGIFIIQ